ncbi:hypothetical protein IAI53_02190 [Thauera sp. CAU 1555]|uniref:Uncharacterized protein n=1 Tax=Thauera sedimentorum TaxID=2767595 RepID=A0ABR9B8A3_9RHOO|nr:hypothetical protein [Thauera sedimentorum]MBC9070763.1 hypothetical protein [Thauera sedimentorum]MBD8501682.1 hypothetical protein [Thauera sedimentorum]
MSPGTAFHSKAKACLQHLAVLLLGALLAVPAAAGEPVIELPSSARPFAVGDKLVLNGLPISMRGFRSAQSVDELVAWFKRRLGAPVVETRHGSTVVLGKAADGHYLTVQLEADRRGVRGLAAVGALRAAAEDQGRYRQRTGPVLAALPHGSRLISELLSEDRGRQSWHLVVDNQYGEQLNSERVTALMRDRGLALERESHVSGEGRLLYFRGNGAEAMATVASAPDRRGAIVINFVGSALEAFQ